MAYQAPGARHTVEAVAKACVHGQIVEEEGFVGTIFKVDQPDRFTRPADADDIAIGETAELQIGGIHEAPAAGDLIALNVGDDVYITIADNVLTNAATALTGGAIEAAYRKVGKVTEVDTTRNPDVLRINGNGSVLAQVAG